MIIMLYEDVNDNKQAETREKINSTESHFEAKIDRSEDYSSRLSGITRLINKLIMKKNHEDAQDGMMKKNIVELNER